MRRHAESFLKSWHCNKNRRPLIVRGARQVGKSTLVHIFAQSQNLELIELNLEKTKLKSLENSDIHIPSILDEVQIKTKKRLNANSLIFFDEIQESPKLIKALRYFYEERPDLAIVSAGSLLEFALNEADMSFPVGRVEFCHLGPMKFSEFLLATGNEYLLEKIESQSLTAELHEIALHHLKNYYYVGGMPFCVKLFAESNSLAEVREAQNQILQSFAADFPKYNTRIASSRIQNVFYACSLQVGKKIIYQKLDPDSQSRDTRRILDLLVKARVLMPCYHSDANSIPLAGESDTSVQKIYFLDVGLLNAILNLDLHALDAEMKNQFNSKGIMAEQFAAQHLAYIYEHSRSPELYYWLRDKNMQKSEVDFLLQQGLRVLPVEVKSSKAGHLKSLIWFAEHKKSSSAIKLSLEPFSVQKLAQPLDTQLYSIPLYAVESLFKLF